MGCAVSGVRKVVVEVEVPEGIPGVESIIRNMVERTLAYIILQEKAKGTLSDDEILEVAREARRRVWERIKNEYTGDRH